MTEHRHERRPDPDALLARVKEEEARSAAGKLKIFFGAAAGVGKTYAMLEAAREQQGRGRRRGGRAASRPTAAPRRRPCSRASRSCPAAQVEYRGTHARRSSTSTRPWRAGPALILVDELAHTNAARLAPRQALAGRRGAARRRHRRLHHAQRPAPREPQRRRGPDHRRHRARDGARLRLRAGRRGRAGRPAARRPAPAPAGRQGLHPRAGPARRSRTSSARAT